MENFDPELDLYLLETLKDFKTLNNRLAGLSERQLHRLIDLEVTGKGRPSFVERIHQRFTRVRADRERAELMKACGAV